MVDRIGPSRPHVERSPSSNKKQTAAAKGGPSSVAVPTRKPGTRTLTEELRHNEDEALGKAFDRMDELKAMGKQQAAQANAERSAELRSRVGRDGPTQRPTSKSK